LARKAADQVTTTGIGIGKNNIGCARVWSGWSLTVVATLRQLGERLDDITAEIETLATADDACQHMMTAPFPMLMPVTGCGPSPGSWPD
jgi:hypothetical protein